MYAIVLILSVILAIAALAIAALIRTFTVESSLAALHSEIAALRRRLDGEGATHRDRAVVDAPLILSVPPNSMEPAPSTADATSEERIPHEVPPPASEEAAAPPLSTARVQRNVEAGLTGRWTVWLGAAVLALGAAFLVKYSVDQGWLGPTVRIWLAILLGVVLLIFGHATRVEDVRRKLPIATPSTAAPALTAAGVVTLFVAFYAAFALYALIPAIAAFVLMAGVATLAVMLSLLNGPFIALLGFGGAFLVPLLVPSKDPSAFGLFGYLLIISAGCLMLIRYRAWWWLAQVSLVLSTLWTLTWLVLSWHAGDEAVVGGYLILLAAGFIFLTRDKAAVAPAVGSNRRHVVHVWASSAATSALMAILAVAAQDSASALLATAILATLFLVAGRSDSGFDRLAWIAAGLVIFVSAAWNFSTHPFVNQREASLVVQPWIPLGAERFVIAAGCFALLLGAGGYWLQWNAKRPWCWASAAIVAPTALLASVYWRISDVATSMPWGPLGLALSTLYLFAAWHTEKHRQDAGMEAALAAYAAGTVAALSLAATMILKEAWLSVALAVQLPTIAWIAAQTRVMALRQVALVLASIVLVRLLLNASILDYPLPDNPILNWILYGYGLPCVSFFLAARLFRRDGEDLLVTLLDAGGIAFGLALITLDIHQIFGNGTLQSRHYGIAEQSLQVSSWLIIALVLLYCARAGRRLAFVYGWKIVTGIAAMHLVVFELAASNPLLSGEAVGNQPIFNLLLMAYGIPAFLAILLGREARRQNEPWPALVAQLAGVILGFVGISLEIRQAFHSPVLSGAPITDGEAYSYSVAWLLYGGALLGFGIYRGSAALRLEGLALITLTVAKAFLFDMSNLTGLYRAASFLALGASLIGIGYLYQRVVFPPTKAAGEPT